MWAICKFYENKVYDIHSLCAKLKKTKAKRLNGFDWWCVIRGDKQILLRKIREKAREA